MSELRELLAELRIIPVLTVQSVAEAVATCHALQQGGIRAVEITLRTEAALDSIREVKTAVSDFQVGAGTVKTVADLEKVAGLGVDFAVSPGLSEAVVEQAARLKVPFLPGVATASEILWGQSLGLDCFKLFPAQAVGGMALLKSLASPFAEVSFCPTGGVNPANYRDYLSLPNVVCVGGSWMVASELIAAGNWPEISRLSSDAMTP